MVKIPSSALGLWSVQLGAMIALAGWAAMDPLFLLVFDAASSYFISPDFGFQQWITTLGAVRPLAFICIMTIASVSMICIGMGMLRRTETVSSLRSVNAWLMLTTIFALWCGLAVNVEEIAWKGKRFRIASQVDALERIAVQLRDEFPHEDGELPHLGPFMAYPFGQPSTLILLQSPSINSQSLSVSAVQRAATGAILLQLSGSDGGAWAEWHPPLSLPQSFVGGLGERYTFRSSHAIGRGWHLVRYAT